MRPALVRPATRADAEALAALRWEFRAGLADAAVARHEFLHRCSRWMDERLADERSGWRCWVASEAAALVGHVWLSLIEKIPNPVAEPERHGYVTNLYVQPAFRGSGTGGRLLQQALACCRQNAIDAVILWPTPASRTLYARHGFASQNGLMELRDSRPRS